MKALIVIGIILLVFFLIGLIPVGADVSYEDGELRLGVRIWRFTIRLGGGKKSRNEPKEKKEKEPGQQKKKKKLPLWLILSLIKNAYALLCRLVAGFRADIRRLHFTSAFEDPSVTAMAYAAAGTAMDGLMRVSGGRIRCSDMRADVDFDCSSPVIDLRVAVHITIGRVLSAAARFAVGVLRDLMAEKRKERKHGKSSDRRDVGRSDGQDPKHGRLEHGGGGARNYA